MTTDPLVEQLVYERMGSGGRCDWKQLRDAVREANMGYRGEDQPPPEHRYPGHEMVDGINYNSLDRIVTAFVDTALATRTQHDREAIAQHSTRGSEAKHYTALTRHRIALPPRLQGGAVDRDDLNMSWILWLHTNDYVHGTCLVLYDDGRAERITIRPDEGDDIWEIKP